MTYFIDRRLNPKGKSLANRQRFLRRARAQIREAVQKSLKDSGVADVAKERKIRISTAGTKEPRFRLDPKKGGERDFVLPGNKEYMPGDEIKKPQGGQGGGGKDAAQSGEGEDDFEFTMREDEILDLFFEDLELPNLVRTTLAEVPSQNWKRAGFTTAGSPTQINLVRTMRNSYGRRLALKRPSLDDIKALEEELATLETAPAKKRKTDEIAALRAEIDRLTRKRKWVSFIDPVDVRFNAFKEQPQPTSRAVMFCLMDVSGSMGEREKDLAKRFYVLLHLFLKRRYEKVDIVFIRHTHDAQDAGSRRARVLLFAPVGRHDRLDRPRQDAGNPEGALRDGRLEHLCRAGLGRLHAVRRCQALRRAPEPGDHADLPVLRLYRDPRRARDGSLRQRRGGR
jgi:uncharacterized protein